jgi:protein SCO1/2
MKTSSKITAIAFILVVTAGLIWFLFAAFGKKNNLPVLGDPGHVAGNFSFINQDGVLVTEKTVRNKVTVAEYFFTSCPGICPVMNKNLEKLYDEFKDNQDFVILSHTVNPEKDSVSVMNRYAKHFNASAPNWQFLTGDKSALYNAAINDYLLSVADSGSQTKAFIHTQYVALLDKQRRIRGFYDATNNESMQKLGSDIRRLLKE